MGTTLVSPAAGPFVAGKVNTQMTPLFHRRAWAASAVLGPTFSFFGEVAGTGTVGPEHTNMTRANELESPREIKIGAMGINFYDTATADIWKIIKNYTVQFIVGGNALLNAPAECWPSGNGLYNTGVNNGMPDIRALNVIAPHIIRLPSGVNFSVQFTGTSQTLTAAAAFIGVFLYGPYSKQVS